MFLLGIGIWWVIIYSLRVTFLGNPLYVLVESSDPDLLEHLEIIVQRDRAQATESELRFLQLFSRLTILELVMFVMEIGLLIVLFRRSVLPELVLVMIAKDLLLVLLSSVVCWKYVDEGLFKALLGIPAWLLNLERLSAFLSAAGGLVLFARLNGFL